jgi:ActR/RegA family two-component response regulator
MAVKVLIIDDNKIYRNAFKRNMLIHNFDVCEAEHADDGIEVLKTEKPDVLVTDLCMRTPTEGLDLIRQAKGIDPLIPIVMISAVGTFEEGAIATKLGAYDVISKSNIEERLERLYKSITLAREQYISDRELLESVRKLRSAEESAEKIDAINKLEDILSAKDIHPYIQGEAYDALVSLRTMELRKDSEADANRLLDETGRANLLEEVEKDFQKDFSDFRNFHKDSRESLRTAELFYRLQSSKDAHSVSGAFSRNIGFSYCFSVENEAKLRLKKRLTRFLSTPQSYTLIKQMLDQRTGHVDIFFHQYILRLQSSAGKDYDFTIDNVKQTFYRILEHENRYKPDGLKALGIIILCFGRCYSFKKMNQPIEVNNPLGLKGLDNGDDVIDFADLLISLQHYRNPYIHPEINEMEKVSKLRSTAYNCLKYICRLV